MKFLERFSINIYNVSSVERLFGRRKETLLREMVESGSLRHILRRGVSMLNDETQAEIRNWVISQQTKGGGFIDRSGDSDLYYTLFGFFLAEALEIDQVFPALKVYAGKTAREHDHEGIELFCMSILNASLFPDDPGAQRYAREIRSMTKNKALLLNGYTPFLAILSLLSLHDYYGVIKVLKAFKEDTSGADKPCTVVAAQQIVAYLKSGGKGDLNRKNTPGEVILYGPFKSFYRNDGGFAALNHTREPDLLSTAVALFALRFMEDDIRLIRPNCFEFITGLYREGGFTAVRLDDKTDVEYTLYGLLALGALNSHDEQN